jgi:hypothetical protein
MKDNVEVRRNGSLLIVRTEVGDKKYTYTVEIRNAEGAWIQSPNNPFKTIGKARTEASRLAEEYSPRDPIKDAPKAYLEYRMKNMDDKIKSLNKRRDEIQNELSRRRKDGR